MSGRAVQCARLSALVPARCELCSRSSPSRASHHPQLAPSTSSRRGAHGNGAGAATRAIARDTEHGERRHSASTTARPCAYRSARGVKPKEAVRVAAAEHLELTIGVHQAGKLRRWQRQHEAMRRVNTDAARLRVHIVVRNASFGLHLPFRVAANPRTDSWSRRGRAGPRRHGDIRGVNLAFALCRSFGRVPRPRPRSCTSAGSDT